MNRFFRLFIVSVLMIFTLIGCERKQTEIIDHYHNQAFTNKYAKDLTVTDCEYEQIRIGYGRNGDYSLGPTDPRYRGVIKISEEQARELYKNMDSLWIDFPGWDIGVITSNEEFQTAFGHKTSNIKKFKAGNLDTCFYIYKRSEK